MIERQPLPVSKRGGDSQTTRNRGSMTTREKDAKAKQDAEEQRQPPLDKPMLKDLAADPEKADAVRGGPTRCSVAGGC